MAESSGTSTILFSLNKGKSLCYVTAQSMCDNCQFDIPEALSHGIFLTYTVTDTRVHQDPHSARCIQSISLLGVPQKNAALFGVGGR